MSEPMKPMAGTDELAADLRSEDPARVRRALETLDHAWKQGRFAPVPMPWPECLDAFGDDVPATAIAHYLSVNQQIRHVRDEAADRHRHPQRLHRRADR